MSSSAEADLEFSERIDGMCGSMISVCRDHASLVKDDMVRSEIGKALDAMEEARRVYIALGAVFEARCRVEDSRDDGRPCGL